MGVVVIMDAPITDKPFQPICGYFLTEAEQKKVWDQIVIPIENPQSSCWRWTGGTNNYGDPIVQLRGQTWSVTHVVWADTGHVRVPKRKRLRRDCGFMWCVNPAHRHPDKTWNPDDMDAPQRVAPPVGQPKPEALVRPPSDFHYGPDAVQQITHIDIPVIVDEATLNALVELPEDEILRELASPAARDILDHNVTNVLDRPGYHSLIIDNTHGVVIYNAPDPECQGHGKTWRDALQNAKDKYAAKALLDKDEP